MIAATKTIVTRGGQKARCAIISGLTRISWIAQGLGKGVFERRTGLFNLRHLPDSEAHPAAEHSSTKDDVLT